MKKRRNRGRVTRKNKKQRAKGRTMPRATVSTAPQRFELKTCPGGWVKMRRMSYGELLTSQDMAFQVQMKASENNSEEADVGVSITRAAISAFQINTCVVDHNLEDENERKLSFSKDADVTSLDPNIGQELTKLIDDLHDWNKQFPNSGKPSANGSSTESTATVAPQSTNHEPDVTTPTSLPSSSSE
jgi:hypothetical protein